LIANVIIIPELIIGIIFYKLHIAYCQKLYSTLSFFYIVYLLIKLLSLKSSKYQIITQKLSFFLFSYP